MVEFIFNDTHFKKFEEALATPLDRDIPGGKKVEGFVKGCTGVSAKGMEKGTIGHDYVLKWVNSDSDIRTKCAIILAWGGMRNPDRDLLFGQEDQGWVGVAKKLQTIEITRKAAFEEFTERRRKNNLKGMGCAYFTKLIYFLQFHKNAHSAKGYIMDQWVAEAVNLLVEGPDIVKLDTSLTLKWKGRSEVRQSAETSSLVSDKNTGQDYENFCAAIEALRNKINEERVVKLTRAQLDRALGGSSRAEDNDKWRPHVKKQRLEKMELFGN
ncbi:MULTISPECIES: hypothetical protein [unclassified Falsihalocynthiibacter]|uniref:8-oxoguanine DNA glycosylase OGG fold protein n=1 Tax=unclassified Falsihalocynthiibacter TaxID=2854191 RepID=UPI00350F8391